MDKILNKFGLTRLSTLRTVSDASIEILYDIKVTYEKMNELLNYNLPNEVKIEINKYIADHDWIEQYDFAVKEDDDLI